MGKCNYTVLEGVRVKDGLVWKFQHASGQKELDGREVNSNNFAFIILDWVLLPSGNKLIWVRPQNKYIELKFDDKILDFLSTFVFFYLSITDTQYFISFMCIA